MIDQAHGLRELKLKSQAKYNNTEVITVTSGKGGVGKSNTSVNLALSMASLGKKVLLIDVDIGLANVDLLLGIYSKYTLFDFFNGMQNIETIIQNVAENMDVISGGSAFTDSDLIENIERRKLNLELEKILGYDYIIFDTGAGITKSVTDFCLIADKVLMVTTPEPTAITDAYALLKSLYKKDKDIKINIVVNRATNSKEGEVTANKLIKVSESFLHQKPVYVGHISDDSQVQKAVKMQKPYSQAYKECSASKDIRILANKIIGIEHGDKKRGIISLFGSFFLR
ncbi:MinD/ParA family protein [Alkalicella caledoniensis]|uniref:MinD/ParA family protein n=1 Tax=Alkalicella caledoniensis TaxID=2731377 RepID=A0A7G9WCM4_ALKCA|nr:MinD/ParA family protein [Alkalicella caledoniensis]QNO16436.1 MinD/ParA family protein [Alkalicella caledoniensis]